MTLNGVTLIVRQTLICLRRYGLQTAFAFLSVNLLRKSGNTRQRIYRVHPRRLAHPLSLRGGRSDFFVFGQIFVEEEFAPLRNHDISRIVDLGGNIGLASVWLLNTFPRAQVVAIEANPENYPSLDANLGPYGDRATVVQGGVWWRRTPLTLVRRQNESDAYVREPHAGETPAEVMEGWDVPSLMTYAGFTHIDLLKIDIEGAEVDLLLHAERWLPQVRNLSIELHGPESEAALDRALASYTCQRQVRGELTFCMNLKPKHPLGAGSAATAVNVAG